MAPPVLEPRFGPTIAPFPLNGIFYGTHDLKQLDDGDFLSTVGETPSLNPRLQSHAKGRLHRLEHGASTLDEMMPIHPCFARGSFDVMTLRQTAFDKDVAKAAYDDSCYREITDAEWEAILPAIREASCILDDPMILDYFGGLLLERWTPLPKKAGNKDLGTIWSFDLLSDTYKRLNPGWESVVWKLLTVGLPHMVRWAFGPSDAHGSTYSTVDEGWFPDTAESCIIINEDYLRTLTGGLKPTDYPHTLSQVDPSNPSKLPSYDTEAARMRCIHGLATTLLHELQHAIIYAFYPNNIKHAIQEPFFRDHRVAEAGYSFEQILFRGVLDPIGPSKIAGISAHPYGSEYSEFPGAIAGLEDKARGSLVKFGVVGADVCPIKMKEIWKFQDQRFWDDQVERFGLAAVAYPAEPGWNVFSLLEPGQRFRWPGESLP